MESLMNEGVRPTKDCNWFTRNLYEAWFKGDIIFVDFRLTVDLGRLKLV